MWLISYSKARFDETWNFPLAIAIWSERVGQDLGIDKSDKTSKSGDSGTNALLFGDVLR